MTLNTRIAVLSGIASALIFYGAITGVPELRLPLMALVAMPIALAGLSFNATTAFVAATVSSVIILALLSPALAVIASLVVLPTAGLVYLCLLYRETGPGEGEWYPIGRVILTAEIIAASLVSVALLLLVGDMDSFRTTVGKAVDTIVKQGLFNLPGAPPAQPLTPTQISQLADIMVVVMPAAGATLMLGSLLVALWLGGRVARAAGTLVRPWPDIAAFSFPSAAPVLLVGALLCAILLDGKPQLIALAFTGAFYTGYVLLGLAVVHYLTRGLSFRTPLLVALYVFLIAVNSAASLALAILGLVETLAPMRKPAAEPPPSGPLG